VKLAKGFGVKFNGADDPNVQAMQEEINELKGIHFAVEQYPNGDWMAKSTNVDGILTGGSSGDNVEELMKDAVFTYYGISSKYCDDKLMKIAGDIKTVRQDVLIAA
jgi:hypothetical protein